MALNSFNHTNYSHGIVVILIMVIFIAGLIHIIVHLEIVITHSSMATVRPVSIGIFFNRKILQGASKNNQKVTLVIKKTSNKVTKTTVS